MMPDHYAEMLLSMPTTAILDAISDQICPACGRGPFRNLGLHFRYHGVAVSELREAHGLNRQHSMASSEFAVKQSKRQKDAMQRDPALDRLRRDALDAASRQKTYVPRRTEGLRNIGAASVRVWESFGEEARTRRIMPAVRASMTVRMSNPDWCRAAGERLNARARACYSDQEWLDMKRRKVPRSEWHAVVSMIESGATQAYVASLYGCNPTTIQNIIKRVKDGKV